MSILTAALESCLEVQWKEQYECVLDPAAPPISLDASQRITEILKILFNITHRTHRQEPSEVSEYEGYNKPASFRCNRNSWSNESTNSHIKNFCCKLLFIIVLKLCYYENTAKVTLLSAQSVIYHHLSPPSG